MRESPRQPAKMTIVRYGSVCSSASNARNSSAVSTSGSACPSLPSGRVRLLGLFLSSSHLAALRLHLEEAGPGGYSKGCRLDYSGKQEMRVPVWAALTRVRCTETSSRSDFKARKSPLDKVRPCDEDSPQSSLFGQGAGGNRGAYLS